MCAYTVTLKHFLTFPSSTSNVTVEVSVCLEMPSLKRIHSPSPSQGAQTGAHVKVLSEKQTLRPTMLYSQHRGPGDTTAFLKLCLRRARGRGAPTTQIEQARAWD